MDTVFHVGGYDMSDPKKPKPCIYYLGIRDNSINKGNQDLLYSGACFCSPDPFTGKIFDQVGKDFINFTLRDAIDFAKFVTYTTKEIMRFCGSNEAMSAESDILVIRPDGHEWVNK